MDAQHLPASPPPTARRRRPVRLMMHAALVPAGGRLSEPATLVSTAGAGALSIQRSPVIARRPPALRAAAGRIRLLQHRVAQTERERDQALADIAELRLRHARSTVRLFTLEAEYQSALVVATDLRLRHARLATRFHTLEREYRAAPQVSDREITLERQLDQVRGAERRQQAMEQELVRLRSTLATWIPLVAPPAPGSIPRSPSAPWYRRLWFGLIGKDVRTAEWSASRHLH